MNDQEMWEMVGGTSSREGPAWFMRSLVRYMRSSRLTADVGCWIRELRHGGSCEQEESCRECREANIAWLEGLLEPAGRGRTAGAGKKAKDTDGKLRLTLVPPRIIKDIAEVREYGTAKYGDPDNWMGVPMGDYVDALCRHLVEFVGDWEGKDPESGLEHYKHAACNLAFIAEMMAEGKGGRHD